MLFFNPYPSFIKGAFKQTQYFTHFTMTYVTASTSKLANTTQSRKKLTLELLRIPTWEHLPLQNQATLAS